MRNPSSAPAAALLQAAAEKAADPREPLTYRGRVIDPSGRPFRGARVYLVNSRIKESARLPVRATSDADGRFRFQLSQSDFDTVYIDEPWSFSTILAYAEDYAFAIVNDVRLAGGVAASLPGSSKLVVANDREGSKELTLRLVHDDVPISGRIIDLEGHPVAGVMVNVVEVRVPAVGSLDGWIKAMEERKDRPNFNAPVVVNAMDEQPRPPGIPPVSTGADGKFLLKGIGRERIATLQVEGPTIEMKHIEVVTRSTRTIRIPAPPNRQDGEAVTIYGASFEHVAAPTRAIEGVVRDLDSGHPLAGILVHSERALSNRGEWRVQAITDEQGRYRLLGLPRGKEGALLALSPVDIPDLVRKRAGSKVPRPEELPYLRARVTVPESRPDRTLSVDIRLKRGVWVTGRILDPSNGKPVRASVDYFAYDDNPHLEASPGFTWSRSGPIHTGKDHRFHLVAFPGPGVLAANVAPGEKERSTYVMGAGLGRFKHKRDDRSLPTQPFMIPPMNYQALAEIDPIPGTAALTRDLVLETGRSLTLKVLDPGGQPLSGIQIAGLNDSGHYWTMNPPEVSTYTISGLKPGRKRLLSFLDMKRQLAGELVLDGHETTSQTVTLQPWGTLTGQVVDADGEPLGQGFLHDIREFRPLSGYPQIGKDGRFRVEGLVPGKPYQFRVMLLQSSGIQFRGVLVNELKLGPGEVRDLGEVVPQRRKSP
jgi:protocatechuate 3,4-dioxygenase beta subunit